MGWPLYAAILLLFAGWLSIHVTLCFLLSTWHKRKALLALVVPPLAPYYALSIGFRKMGLTWAALFTGYLSALFLGLI